MSTLATSPVANHSYPAAWSTIRFRRAKEKKGWALLGIPSQVYPLVALRLFELQARLIEQHNSAPFISLLFEAPPAVSAKLACAFPAPPGCEALKISESAIAFFPAKLPNLPRPSPNSQIQPTQLQLQPSIVYISQITAALSRQLAPSDR
ncbi:MAG: hypothetical protein HC886_17990 [Leptolyngbyaceae cyanobacterium SM1_1_3]|nr:hypothetical protein [Leptolyngbyaceae cyanobacterium SM1_1_3]NJO08888.1 hypothetical protein [Leptolyngbyaceae cyanobacterium SL_1_1]